MSKYYTLEFSKKKKEIGGSLYRFRSIESLIGEERQELERQQIYFASLDELNDPIEGKRHYFWQGDRIIWENFLKHFLFCLSDVINLSRLIENNETIEKSDIPIFNEIGENKFYKERIQKIYKHFFSDSFVQNYLQILYKNKNKIYQKELYIHLKILSKKALSTIFEIDAQNGLFLRPENTVPKTSEKKLNLDFSLFENGIDEEFIDLAYVYEKSREIESILMYKNSPKLQFVHVEFLQYYIAYIVELTYPPAYVACFMDNCDNSSIWGTYGQSHTGVCLKFKIENESTLTLKTRGKTDGYRQFDLKEMEYSSEPDELDFFRNLGRLPRPQLEKQWYTDENRNISICYDDITLDEEEWRKKYWNGFEGAFLKKLSDWSHESEYRIILSSVLGSYDEPKNRTLEYKFEDLEGIIFGLKTPKNDKIKIIEIVKRKCKEHKRNQFDFFEMDVNSKNELYRRKLHININNDI